MAGKSGVVGERDLKRFFKKVRWFFKNRVIIEGSADRSEVRQEERRARLVGIVKNIQPISVGV